LLEVEVAILGGQFGAAKLWREQTLSLQRWRRIRRQARQTDTRYREIRMAIFHLIEGYNSFCLGSPLRDVPVPVSVGDYPYSSAPSKLDKFQAARVAALPIRNDKGFYEEGMPDLTLAAAVSNFIAIGQPPGKRRSANYPTMSFQRGRGWPRLKRIRTGGRRS
jgi:hypothetical protein